MSSSSSSSATNPLKKLLDEQLVTFRSLEGNAPRSPRDYLNARGSGGGQQTQVIQAVRIPAMLSPKPPQALTSTQQSNHHARGRANSRGADSPTTPRRTDNTSPRRLVNRGSESSMASSTSTCSTPSSKTPPLVPQVPTLRTVLNSSASAPYTTTTTTTTTTTIGKASPRGVASPAKFSVSRRPSTPEPLTPLLPRAVVSNRIAQTARVETVGGVLTPPSGASTSSPSSGQSIRGAFPPSPSQWKSPRLAGIASSGTKPAGKGASNRLGMSVARGRAVTGSNESAPSVQTSPLSDEKRRGSPTLTHPRVASLFPSPNTDTPSRVKGYEAEHHPADDVVVVAPENEKRAPSPASTTAPPSITSAHGIAFVSPTITALEGRLIVERQPPDDSSAKAVVLLPQASGVQVGRNLASPQIASAIGGGSEKTSEKSYPSIINNMRGIVSGSFLETGTNINDNTGGSPQQKNSLTAYAAFASLRMPDLRPHLLTLSTSAHSSGEELFSQNAKRICFASYQATTISGNEREMPSMFTIDMSTKNATGGDLSTFSAFSSSALGQHLRGAMERLAHYAACGTKLSEEEAGDIAKFQSFLAHISSSTAPIHKNGDYFKDSGGDNANHTTSNLHLIPSEIGIGIVGARSSPQITDEGIGDVPVAFLETLDCAGRTAVALAGAATTNKNQKNEPPKNNEQSAQNYKEENEAEKESAKLGLDHPKTGSDNVSDVFAHNRRDCSNKSKVAATLPSAVGIMEEFVRKTLFPSCSAMRLWRYQSGSLISVDGYDWGHALPCERKHRIAGYNKPVGCKVNSNSNQSVQEPYISNGGTHALGSVEEQLSMDASIAYYGVRDEAVARPQPPENENDDGFLNFTRRQNNEGGEPLHLLPSGPSCSKSRAASALTVVGENASTLGSSVIKLHTRLPSYYEDVRQSFLSGRVFSDGSCLFVPLLDTGNCISKSGGGGASILDDGQKAKIKKHWGLLQITLGRSNSHKTIDGANAGSDNDPTILPVSPLTPTKLACFIPKLTALGNQLRALVFHFDQLLKNQKTSEAMQTVVNIAHSLANNEVLDEDRLIHTIMESARKVCDAERTSLFTLAGHDASGHWTELVARSNAGAEIRVPRGKGVVGYVAETGRAMNIKDVRNSVIVYDSPVWAADGGYVTKTLLCVPITFEGQLVAVAELINKIDPNYQNTQRRRSHKRHTTTTQLDDKPESEIITLTDDTSGGEGIGHDTSTEDVGEDLAQDTIIMGGGTRGTTGGNAPFPAFSEDDEEVFGNLMTLLGLCLRNCTTENELVREKAKIEGLLGTVLTLSEADLSDMTATKDKVLLAATKLATSFDAFYLLMVNKERNMLELDPSNVKLGMHASSLLSNDTCSDNSKELLPNDSTCRESKDDGLNEKNRSLPSESTASGRIDGKKQAAPPLNIEERGKAEELGGCGENGRGFSSDGGGCVVESGGGYLSNLVVTHIKHITSGSVSSRGDGEGGGHSRWGLMQQQKKIALVELRGIAGECVRTGEVQFATTFKRPKSREAKDDNGKTMHIAVPPDNNVNQHQPMYKATTTGVSDHPASSFFAPIPSDNNADSATSSRAIRSQINSATMAWDVTKRMNQSASLYDREIDAAGIDPTNLESVLGIPILVNGEVIAVLQLVAIKRKPSSLMAKEKVQSRRQNDTTDDDNFAALAAHNQTSRPEQSPLFTPIHKDTHDKGGGPKDTINMSSVGDQIVTSKRIGDKARTCPSPEFISLMKGLALYAGIWLRNADLMAFTIKASKAATRLTGFSPTVTLGASLLGGSSSHRTGTITTDRSQDLQSVVHEGNDAWGEGVATTSQTSNQQHIHATASATTASPPPTIDAEDYHEAPFVDPLEVTALQRFALPEEHRSKLDTPSFDLWALRRERHLFRPTLAVKRVVLDIIMSTGLPREFGCKEETLASFIIACRKRYRSVPYHSFFHAVDVLQTIHTFLYMGGASKKLSRLEQFVMFIVAIAHDLDHMGLNNSYYMKSESPLGILNAAGGNTSVLEVHHCNVAIDILSNPAHNVFAGLSKDQLQYAYRLMIDAILQTDMAKHADTVSQLKNYDPDMFDVESSEHRKFAALTLLKAADISNVTKPFSISREWGMAVVEEFSQQGDREKSEGLMDVLPMFDREKNADLAKGQIGFMDFVAIPFYSLVVEKLFPGMNFALKQLKANRETWLASTNSPQSND